MKLQTILCLLTLLFVGTFTLIGCATSPVNYSFTGINEWDSPSIYFREGNPGVSFVSFDGRTLPRPERGTHWNPIHFPSGRELRIIVHADYSASSRTTFYGFGVIGAIANTAQDVISVSRNVDTNVVFNSPPLEAGRRYRLFFSKEPGLPGRNILTLVDIDAGRIVYQQEFETTFGGFRALD